MDYYDPESIKQLRSGLNNQKEQDQLRKFWHQLFGMRKEFR